jgi:putative ABC transport system ATP-binding protein
MTLAVTCKNIEKKFGTGEAAVYALQDLSLEVTEGVFLLLVGPSGCGKTTLISVIAGILMQDSGECEVLGQNLKSLRSRDLLDFRAKNIGFIFQSFNLLPSITIAENVAVPLMINGMEWTKAEKIANDLLEEVGLGGRGKSLPGLLSGGQQQRVAIARAIVHNPKILVCDEPTSALDHETGQKIMELLKRLNESRKTTLLVVTHDNRIFPYASRIAHMDDGKIERFE